MEYLEVNGTSYPIDTDPEEINILEMSRAKRFRIVLEYGDVKTGEVWMDATPNRGFIGRSMGPVKIPLLIRTNRSYGGEATLEHCIVRICESKGGKEIYKRKI